MLPDRVCFCPEGKQNECLIQVLILVDAGDACAGSLWIIFGTVDWAGVVLASGYASIIHL